MSAKFGHPKGRLILTIDGNPVDLGIVQFPFVADVADDPARKWSTEVDAVYMKDVRQRLVWLRVNGRLGDGSADPAPVDPALDETDKRDRTDSDGDRWQWSGDDEVWRFGDTYSAFGNLATLARHYGPLRFANEDDEETDDE